MEKGIQFRDSRILKFLKFILVFKSPTCIVLDKLEQACKTHISQIHFKVHVNRESLQINERYSTTEDTKWNLQVKVYLSIYLLYISYCCFCDWNFLYGY